MISIVGETTTLTPVARGVDARGLIVTNQRVVGTAVPGGGRLGSGSQRHSVNQVPV